MFQAVGKTIEFPGYLRAYVEGSDDPEADLADREAVLPTVSVGETLRCTSLRAQEPYDAAAESVQRSLAHPGAGRDGHRTAEHLCLDHRHDPRPRVRLQAQPRQRAGAHLDGVRRFATARGPSARVGQLPVHGRDGGRARRDQPRRDESSRLPAAVLFRQRPSGLEAVAGRQDQRDRRPRRVPHFAGQAVGRDGRSSGGDFHSRRPLRTVHRARRSPGEPARQTAARRS